MHKKQLISSILIASVIIVLLWLFFSRGAETESQPAPVMSTDMEHRGEQLARRYCVSCHAFPEPDLLDKVTWQEQTLPSMGPHLGIFEFAGQTYPLDVTDGLPENFYPETALIDSVEWQIILDYYSKMAPVELSFQTGQPSIEIEDAIFEPRRPDYRPEVHPMASAVKFDPGNGVIYLADGNLQRILVYNRDLTVEASLPTPGPVSDILFTNDAGQKGIREMILTFIGDISPSERKEGSIVRAWYDPSAKRGEIHDTIIDNIGRPVEALLADLDGDGIDDLLISEFGHRTGSVFWLKGDEQGFDKEKQILTNSAGCLQAHVTDITGSGLPNILALCSQLDQALYLFENRGGGNFRQSTLLQFPVTAGSSSFELADMNGDGHPDILYTSGDNADYSLTYKPYHGVYLYLNDGENNFHEKWFYHVNGAYSVKARDFTGNGDHDIALISFFADYTQKPQEGFLFFQNEGDLTFTPRHPQMASFGRWIAMDVADWTGNSVDDIVLANFSMGPTRLHPRVEQIITQSPHLLVLENNLTQQKESP